MSRQVIIPEVNRHVRNRSKEMLRDGREEGNEEGHEVVCQAHRGGHHVHGRGTSRDEGGAPGR
jgi:hypothetical protein